MHVDALSLQRREHPEHEPDQDRHDQGDRQDPQVDARLADAREGGRGEPDQDVHADPRHEDTEDGGRAGQEQALHQELPSQAGHANAQRRPHGNLASARGGTCEQEVRHVRARHEQDERHGAKQHQQRWPHRAEHDRRERLDEHASGIVLRIIGFQLGGQPSELLLGRLQRRAGRETPHHEDGVRPARVDLRVSLQRHPDVHVGADSAVGERARVVGRRQDREHAEIRVGRHDPDDRERRVVQDHGATEHLRVATVEAIPETLTEQHDVSAARTVLRRREPSAEDRASAEERQQVVRDGEGAQPAGVTTLRRQVDLPPRERPEPVDPLAQPPIVLEIGKGGGLAGRPTVPVGFPRHDETVDGFNRGRPEQDAVHHAEDGRIGPDAERERDDRRQREARGAREQAPRVTKVVGPHRGLQANSASNATR